MKNPIHFYEFFPDNNHFHCRFGRRRQTARSPLLRFQSRSESVGHLRLTNGIHRLPLRRLGQDAEPAVVQQGKEQPGIGLARAIKRAWMEFGYQNIQHQSRSGRGEGLGRFPGSEEQGGLFQKRLFGLLVYRDIGPAADNSTDCRIVYASRREVGERVAFFVKIFDSPAAAKIRIHVEGVAEIGSSAAEEPLLLPGQPDLPVFATETNLRGFTGIPSGIATDQQDLVATGMTG